MSDNDRFYTYALFRENEQPFWIGHGKDNRCYVHLKLARRNRTEKDRVILGILSRGFEVPVVKITEGLSKIAAQQQEIAVIAAVGRSPLGPLVNRTGGGEGGSLGHRKSQETRELLSKIAFDVAADPEKKKAQIAGTRHAMAAIRPRLREIQREIGSRPEVREKRRRDATGKVASATTRLKMSLARKGKPNSPETRQRIRDALARRRAMKAS